jgi:hypothetical protein
MQKENPDFERREKYEERVCRNRLQHHKRDSTFTDMHKVARLQFLSLLSRYERMNESLHVAGGARHSTTYSVFAMWALPVTPR